MSLGLSLLARRAAYAIWQVRGWAGDGQATCNIKNIRAAFMLTSWSKEGTGAKQNSLSAQSCNYKATNEATRRHGHKAT